MQQPRMVPPIAQLRQQISRDNAKPIQSPLSFGPPSQPQQSPEATIGEAVQDLALDIYSALAVAHIQHNQATDRETLHELAKSSQVAALTYFQAMGVQFNEDPNRGQS